MSKTNDTTKTCELTEAELAAVSGGAIIAADFAYPIDWMGRRSDGERS